MADQISIIATSSDAFNLAFDFDLLKAPNGIPNRLTEDVQPLRTSGVDGSVYRAMGKQFIPFPIRTIKSHVDFDAAVQFLHDLESMRNSFVVLVSDAHGVHNNLFCSAVLTTPHAGQLNGPGIALGGQAYTMSDFTMVHA